MSFNFDPDIWGDASNVAPEDRCDLGGKKLLSLHPELSKWDPLEIEWAWGWYSQTVWLVSWLEIEERDPTFLDFLVASQTPPRPSEGVSLDELKTFRHCWSDSAELSAEH